ncbi:hypothetical protein BIFGAL_03367 [Bifidobacterium gallicum DSM 20093 = LMG 11596]|uniref:Uncharacterized protein n=1 Tax=Bifidobacterium gallicum DSM 20093 = LMG 11596 TaxID=561180 RepID=D1NU46_9BIFI|nr:hypothetical protein BIFGAL_03367 [Bifidobacterium gallicum DSM 20093 = LMG 11596]
MRFWKQKCNYPDHAGQERCIFRTGIVVLLTMLVRKDALWGLKVQFC